MRIALYGAGKYYINRRNEVAALFADDEVVALFDNKFYTETKVDGIILKVIKRDFAKGAL